MVVTPFLISLSAFIGIVLFFLAVSSYLLHRQEHQKFIEKIENLGNAEGLEETAGTSSRNDSFLKRQLLEIAGFLGKLVRPKSESELSHIRRNFVRAGYHGKHALVTYFGMKTFLAILLPTGFFLLKVLFIKFIPHVQAMALSLCLALIGFYLPNLWLRYRIARRKEKILEGFPDALDLMIVCVEAGTGLDTAIHRVGEEMKFANKVLSEEFVRLSLELRAGKSRQDALRNLATRTDLDDVSSLITLLIQTDKFGTSVAEALRVCADSMRTRRFQKAEEIAEKLPVKLVFPLILFIFPALFVIIAGPAIITIYRVLLPAMGQ